MNDPLEIKISMKDVEPIKEFLGSVQEFQKAIFKLSGNNPLTTPIKWELLKPLGFREESNNGNSIYIGDGNFKLIAWNGLRIVFMLNEYEIHVYYIEELEFLIRILNL